MTWLESPHGQVVLRFSKTSSLALEPIQTAVHLVGSGVLSRRKVPWA